MRKHSKIRRRKERKREEWWWSVLGSHFLYCFIHSWLMVTLCEVAKQDVATSQSSTLLAFILVVTMPDMIASTSPVMKQQTSYSLATCKWSTILTVASYASSCLDRSLATTAQIILMKFSTPLLWLTLLFPTRTGSLPWVVTHTRSWPRLMETESTQLDACRYAITLQTKTGCVLVKAVVKPPSLRGADVSESDQDALTGRRLLMTLILASMPFLSKKVCLASLLPKIFRICGILPSSL